MTNIHTPDAPVNGDATTSRKKFLMLDAVHRDRRLSAADKDVAYFIINWFNPAKGYAWPSQERLAEVTSLDLRAAKRAVVRLVAFGVITIRTHGSGRGHANEYVPNWEYKGDSTVTLSVPSKGDSAVTVSDAERVTALSRKGDSAGIEKVTALPPHTLPPPSISEGVVRDPDAGALAPDGARTPRRGDRASALHARLWALPFAGKDDLRALECSKRAVAKVVTRADVPSDDELVAKAESYLANTPRPRWLSKWLEIEGWRCDPPRPKASKPERASKVNGATNGKVFEGFKLGAVFYRRSDKSKIKVVGERGDEVELLWLSAPDDDDLSMLQGRRQWYKRCDLEKPAMSVSECWTVADSDEADDDEPKRKRKRKRCWSTSTGEEGVVISEHGPAVEVRWLRSGTQDRYWRSDLSFNGAVYDDD